ncbi:2-amino-4-oxopentanoate thiolase subunit OrtB [Geosporobacter ferrireducens]|uniref:PLP-dependent lyase/thiolase n=1 Tax=Geosporobacter ferrireducens TaxID=1424294 RepID=A0A1D8GKV3_9FIRM|nr:2-amino-4-oxopentanoate thiolase subunit OrtB [Geosporobacter ferrireducens]AOT71539.1 PLP-dependent lyase/thiolase [Geosporobacter ferrireducens]MTI57853.1 PLP-dependent lyase/thiolase [Geosporobacter ferrireducens]
MRDLSYKGVIARKNEIMKDAVGIDYSVFEYGKIAFDYEKMMNNAAYSIEEMQKIQRETKVGNTPLYELKNITKLVRKYSEPGKGARIFVKDEAANASGSFKARRAAISVYHARKNGYKGVIAATSGNYGAAVASQAAQRGLKSIIIQEVYDSSKKGQPEIIEKARKCEAFGAEVVQLTVGPELFYTFLKVIEETGFFNASLYTPFGIAGVETLGYEIANQMMEMEGRYPDTVVATHAGGGNLTGTARGLIKAGAVDCEIVGASVDLHGLHMASDKDFNRKSFTTGHTGFGIPFAAKPDRADVPRNAARVLRYMDRYVTVTQGEVFFITEMMAKLEGLERGPAGNTSLAAAIALAKEMDQDKIIVVQETEYTGAGKHPMPQLTFARNNGIKIYRGNPEENIPGETIVIPTSLAQVSAKDVDLIKLKTTYLKNIADDYKLEDLEPEDIKFLSEDIKLSEEKVVGLYKKL